MRINRIPDEECLVVCREREHLQGEASLIGCAGILWPTLIRSSSGLVGHPGPVDEGIRGPTYIRLAVQTAVYSCPSSTKNADIKSIYTFPTFSSFSVGIFNVNNTKGSIIIRR